ncbi:WW domain-binding protein 4 [Lucilia cuprina]|uniref:WW domain-binding protein 4 n=1 Tax=Lucilia cuprina TaxID=7375 RepID=UPI001F05CAD2|nr:WW domain-binding protein 4 [Lucilia cuprina]XP_046808063.1 WW domain-binding protein 4 [Lucilia cuprina]XP_046808069.1 WW domain-binding protein 4 [Lucilia cuprina]
MADYWKSNERKYCDFCKCWISDNKASISFHENGKRHKLNVAKRITDISRNSEKSEQEKRKMDAEIRKMEEAAMRSYAHDIHSRGDLTARSINAVMTAGVGPSTSAAVGPHTASNNFKQVDPMRLAGNSDDEDEMGPRVGIPKVDHSAVPNASLWVEGVNDEGYSYYWNVKTNESVWEVPKEGYLSWKEYQRINDLAIKQQEIQEAEQAKKFRENVNEEVARYNRERLKMFRPPVSKQEQKAEEERKESFKTEEEAKAPEIGQWQVVENKPPAAPIDLELPAINNYYAAPVVSDIPYEPPVKRFKEKTIETLDAEVTNNTSTSFKKRKFAAKGNARKRLDND